jgi:hypothetical protein
MDLSLKQYILGLIIIPILHYLIDKVSDVNPENRSRFPIWISALCGYIVIILNTYILFFSFLVFVRDLIKYGFRYNALSPADLAKKYESVNVHSGSFSSLLSDFPMNREIEFKQAITERKYCWKLNRFIGRFEDFGGKIIADSINIEISNKRRKEKKECENLKLEKDFNALLS